MSQPVQLIVANATHEIAEAVDNITKAKAAASDAIEGLTGQKFDFANHDLRQAIVKGFAERLLCQIAHNADPRIVRQALAAIGAPHEDDEIWNRLEAARDAQRQEAGGDANPAPSPN